MNRLVFRVFALTHPNAIASVGTISALLTGIVGCIHESDGTQADQIAREEIHAQSSSVKTGPAEPSDTSATGQADPGINHTDDSVSEITMSEILISPQELGHRFMGNSWTTCADGFRVSGMPARDVLRLSLLCGPYHGMRRTEHEWNGYVAELNPVEVDVVVESNHCVRVFAAADPTMEMKLDLLDSSGIMVGTAHALAGIAMVGPDGAICAKNGGPYRVRIDSVHGSGMVALTVWTLPPTRE